MLDESIKQAENGELVMYTKGQMKQMEEETFDDWRRVRGLSALREIQCHAAQNGLSEMTLDDINAEVAAARQEMQEREV